MATESSAIVRFISAAQQDHHHIQDSSAAVPDFTDDLKPIRRSYRWPLLILGALAFATVAAAAGVFVGKYYFAEEGAAPAAQAQAPDPVTTPPAAPAAKAPSQPAPSPAAPAAAPEPEPAVALAPTTPAPASPAPAAPASPAPEPPITPQVLAATGFDIRVKPQATITLDGRVLGKSPLRVRNLTPGAHVVDVEAPAGFFSRRVELDLNAGEPQNVNLALDPIDPGDTAKASKAKKVKPDKKKRARRLAKRKSRRARAKARRAEVAEAVALPDSSATGTLLIGSKPPCDIYIDGEPTGLKTPQRAIELPAGTHRVTLINAELDIKKSFTVKITSGKSTRAIHDLTGKI